MDINTNIQINLTMIPPPIFPSLPKSTLIRPVEDPEEGDDYFDLLPDPILTLILNAVLDAKSLCRCLVVSKRFASLVPLVDSLSVVANPTLPAPPRKSFSSTFLKSLFSKLLKSPKKTAPIPNFIGPAELSNWISRSLNNFPQIRHLRLQLPDNGGIVGFPDTTGGLLKWSAEFGKDLQRCAIIGATSFHKPPSPSPSSTAKPNPNQNLLSDEDLRSRVVWILSCLIAACARHGVTRKTLLDYPELRTAVIGDARKQGRLSMNHDQIKQLRESTDSEPIWKRTTVPNVIVKLWYAPELVLPTSGYVMQGATVVAIKPDSGRPEDLDKEYELLRAGFGGDEAEEEVVEEAVLEIVKSKWKLMYKLQMNSF